MRITADTNAREFRAALERYIRVTRRGVPGAIRQQGRLLMARVTSFTPPRTLSQGRKAVKRDIHRAVQPFGVRGVRSPRLRELLRARDYSGLNAFAENVPNLPKRWEPFSEGLHSGARGSRGRVHRPTGVATPDTDAVASYVKRKQGMVGQGRGGWVTALQRLGGKAPAFAARHAGAGTFRDTLGDDLRGELVAENRSGWASSGDPDGVISRAMRSRAVSVIKAADKALERAGRSSLK